MVTVNGNKSVNTSSSEKIDAEKTIEIDTTITYHGEMFPPRHLPHLLLPSTRPTPRHSASAKPFNLPHP